MGTPVHTPPHHTSSSMADVSDSRLADAYAAVRSDSDPTTWAVAGYDKDAKDKIVLEATGTGSLDELAGHFHEDACQFAYLRVTTGDEESKRAKFVFIAWTPQGRHPQEGQGLRPQGQHEAGVQGFRRRDPVLRARRHRPAEAHPDCRQGWWCQLHGPELALNATSIFQPPPDERRESTPERRNTS